jgi:endonuclease/exonuclease/phosphatase family metal-dependent hydrolase
MSYNVENLFDTDHDNEKDDWTFLPNSTKGKKEKCEKISYKRYRKACFDTDWTNKRLELKLKQIKDVLTRERKELPDILALQEIENANVIGKLAKLLGYKKYEVSNSPDKRGVDVAILYRPESGLKMVSRKEHILSGEYFKKKPSRNILEVEFLVDGKQPLTVFANHWPSLGNPNETRVAAAKSLRDRTAQILKANSNHHIMALGDFNTIDRGEPHPFSEVLLKGGHLTGVHETYMQDKTVSAEAKKKMSKGTYFYIRGNTWNLLDRIFVSKNLLDKKGAEVVLDSYQIYAPSFITRTFEYNRKGDKNFGKKVHGMPRDYDFAKDSAKEAGYSDHFPVLVKLKL